MNTEDAFKLFQEVKTCLAAGGFNLRKWASNSEEVSNQIAVYNKTISTEEASSTDEEDAYDATIVEKRARYLRMLLGHFWTRWSYEYLWS